MWSNYSQPHQTHLYPLPPPHSYSLPNQIRPHLLAPPPYHHPPHHPFPAPTYWPYQHPSQPSHHLPSTYLRNKPMSSNPPPFQPKTGFTKSTVHRVAKQKQEHKIRMRHLIRMLSLGPPPPPLAAPADQPVRRSRGGRRTSASICGRGRGRGSILNNRLGRVYGQHNTSDTKYEDEFKSRNGEQTETRTEKEENKLKDSFSVGQMIEHRHSTQILPPENYTPSSGPSFTPLNIDLPPSNPHCSRLPPPPRSCIPLPSSDLPSPSSFPLPPLSSNPPPPNSCHPQPNSCFPPPKKNQPPPVRNSFPPPKKNQPPPVRNSFPPPSDCHQLTGSSITPPGSGLPPPASSIPASTILNPPENSSLYTRRPTQTVETCDWKPTRTVDYEGVWSPGVVTEYREKVVGAGEVFQPEMFDYGHGGEEGGEVEGEETVKQCEGEKEEGVSNIERKEYSRKRLVGFF